MTNDEKAKAYDMALEAARKELGCDRKEYKVVEQVLKSIFPKLRESEDERIRKEIRDLLINACEADRRYPHLLAWLEKQKEQKPVEWSEEDKKILDDVSHILIGLNYKQIARDYKQAVEKLIYARPQWKPTEEQMEALRRAVNKLANTDVADSVRLSIMYDNLKKL